ncbi:MAG TPA: hypothetical protein VII94_05960 [Candidatus Saccharimonadales bacterium]
MRSPSNKPSFWITNISPRNVTLADLAINIKAYMTVNLLDTRHYKYTMDQLQKSKQSGSIFNKRDKIILRETEPTLNPNEEAQTLFPKEVNLTFAREAVIPNRSHSVLIIDNIEYDELKVSKEDKLKQDEIYAQENADLAEIDIQRSIPIKYNG